MAACQPSRFAPGRPYPRPQPVTPQLFSEVMAYVRMQMSGAASKLKAELRARFPNDDILESWALVYPHFWDEQPNRTTARRLLGTVQTVFCSEDSCIRDDLAMPDKDTGPLLEPAGPLLDWETLDEQFESFFTDATEVASKLPKTIEVKSSKKGGPSYWMEDSERTQRFWREMQRGLMSSRAISEYLKLAKLILVLVPGSVEDERAFSTWGFIHSDLRSRMKEPHLNDCMHLYKQTWWDLGNFPYKEALDVWHAGASERGRYQSMPK